MSVHATQSVGTSPASVASAPGRLTTRDARAVRARRTTGRGLAYGPRFAGSSDGGLSLVVATPAAAPQLWSKYVDGAWKSYSRHGVTAALDMDEVASGATTTLFYVVQDRDGHMLGGVRAQGPYAVVEQSHVLIEWKDSPGLTVVTAGLRARLPHGIVEMKSAWVGTGGPAKAVSALLARSALPTLNLTGSRYLLASAADHVLRQWESSGGRIDMNVPAAAYPSEDYRTRLMWWDRQTIEHEAHPAVWTSMSADAAALAGRHSSAAVA